MGQANSSGPKAPKAAAPDNVQMVVAAKNRGKGTDRWLQFLDKNPQQAKAIGRGIDRALSNFADAFPGETRTKRYSNDQWRKAGYDYVAEANKKLGLEDS